MEKDQIERRIAEIKKDMDWHRGQMERWNVPMREEIKKTEELVAEKRQLEKGLLGPVKNARRIAKIDAKIRETEAEAVKFDAKAQEHADARMELLKEQQELDRDLRGR